MFYSAMLMSLMASVAFPIPQEPNLKVTATFEPATAKPGETVTLKIKIDIDPSWHTYPTVQPEKAAASFVNKMNFPETGPIVGVEKTVEPKDPVVEAIPALDIEKLNTYPGGGTWERKVVVSPTAKAGTLESQIKLKVSICNQKGCLPPKALEVTATLKVAGDAVPVDPKYKGIMENLKK